ncbi:MAG: PAS domain-containing protein, partial [Betaproteobacteria bacterium]
KQSLIVPLSIGWRLALVILVYFYVCSALWWVLGRWLRQQFVRFSSIAKIADEYRTERGLSAGDLEKLHAQAIREHDEAGQLAGSFVAMVQRIEDGRLAQQASARGLKLAWQQRTEAEQGLEKSARRFEAVACASRAYAWEFDADFNLVYVSEGVELLLGYTPEERLQEGSICNGTGPGAAMHVRLWDALRRCLREGIPFRGIEVELHHRDGRIVHVLCAGTPALAENGAIRGVVGTSTDIGEIKRARDRVDTLLESTGAVLYACRPEGDYGATYVSANVLDVMGCEAREFTDDPGFWLSRVHPEDAPKLIADVSRLREVGTLKHEYRFMHADGTYRWMFDDLRLVRDSTGAPVEIVGFWLDVTQRRTDEAQQRESHKLEAIGRLTGGVAHEFNNLLGVIVGNLDLMGEKSPGDRHQAAALEAALKGADITRSLLAVAQHLPLSLETHDLDLLLEEMLPVLVSSLEPDVRLRSSLWGGGELLVHLDAGGLGNMVMALVDNAREAMRMMPGRHFMVLRTRMETAPVGNTLGLAPGGYAVLEVVDTGIGMTESVREKAFEPFFTTKDRVKGGGLGLAMVYGYAEQLGGTARIESARDAGTRVSVYLPLDPSHAQRPPRTETDIEKAKADA